MDIIYETVYQLGPRLSETMLRSLRSLGSLGSLGSLFVDEPSFRRTPESSKTDGFSYSAVTVLRERTRKRARARARLLPQGPLVWLPLNGQTDRVNGLHNQVVGKNKRSVHAHAHVYVYEASQKLTADS